MVSTAKTLSERFDPKLLAALDGLDLKARYVMEGYLSGIHKSPFHGFSVEFSDYRNYEAGDDLRHLDWRLYARSDRLCVKRYMQETNARCYLICDTSASMRYQGSSAWGSKLECAKVLAAAVTWFLIRQNDAAGMVTVSGPDLRPEYIRPSQKSSQFGVMLRHLNSLQAAGNTVLRALLQHAVRLAHRRSIVLFLSDLLEPVAEVELSFKQLRHEGHETLVFQILDPDELEFPFAEPQVFEDLESAQRRVVNPRHARADYLRRFNAFMNSYKELFRSLEIPHCVVRTDEDPCRALALFFNERRKLM